MADFILPLMIAVGIVLEWIVSAREARLIKQQTAELEQVEAASRAELLRTNEQASAALIRVETLMQQLDLKRAQQARASVTHKALKHGPH